MLLNNRIEVKYLSNMKLKIQSCVEITPEEIKGIMVRRMSSVTYLELVKEGG